MSINIKEIIKSDSFSGLILMLSLCIAVILSNSILYEKFLSFIYLPMSFKLGDVKFETSLLNFVNHGLMTLFFLIIGLEMKYHLVAGQFSDKTKMILPLAAAVGGVVLPSLIYGSFNYKQETIGGWAIPIATDTAFVLGILSFFGKRISLELRVFILGFSLIDDGFAIFILAAFYTPLFNPNFFLISLIFISLLAVLNFLKVRNLNYYGFFGILLWVFIEKSGIHGTLAGVIIALFIPVHVKEVSISPLKNLEHILSPYVKFLILPLFALINSALPLKNIVIEDLYSNLSLGIIFGLFVGKQIGIFIPAIILTKLKYATLPENTSWSKFYAISILSGIGFTLSLFIGEISFKDEWSLNTMKSAVIITSIISAIVGIILLKFSKTDK